MGIFDLIKVDRKLMDRKFTVDANSYTNEVYILDEQSRLIYRKHKLQFSRKEIDVHSDYWSIGFFNLNDNDSAIVADFGELNLAKSWVAIFLPPFSMIEWDLKEGSVEWVYFLSKSALPNNLCSTPRVITDLDESLILKLLSSRGDLIIDWLKKRNYLAVKKSCFQHYISDKFKLLIDENFRSTKELSLMVEDLGVAQSMASRLFKKQFGITPSEYRNQLRMKQASVDLLFDNKSVESVQYNVGLQDSSYFYKCFKKYINSTPSQFRLPY